VPIQPRLHLLAARAHAAKHERTLRWEVNRIGHALAEIGVRVVLLKGAAYLMAGLPGSRGRVVSDTDILVRARNSMPSKRRSEGTLGSADHRRLRPTVLPRMDARASAAAHKAGRRSSTYTTTSCLRRPATSPTPGNCSSGRGTPDQPGVFVLSPAT